MKCFFKNKNLPLGLGKANNVTHKIFTKTDYPIFQKQYPIPEIKHGRIPFFDTRYLFLSEGKYQTSTRIGLQKQIIDILIFANTNEYQQV